MITLQELYTYLDQTLNCGNFTDFGPNGLQVEGKPHVCKIATGVSASLQTIEAGGRPRRRRPHCASWPFLES